MPTLVPEADRAPSLVSRVVTIHATDVTEGAPAPDSFTFALPCALRVPDDEVILRPGGVKVRLVDGRAQVRLPVYSDKVQTVDGSSDWVIIVTPSWGNGSYPIRVPAGSGAISLADLPAVRPLTRREQAYAITSVGVTVTEGTQASGSAELVNGNLGLKIQVPSFRPETVYPYIDQTADARAKHYETEVRADLDERLREVTTAYDLAKVQGYEGTLTEWLASLRGPKGDASTVPGPPNVLKVGKVTTGAAGSQADASITGSSPSQTLTFTIPRGDKGETGKTGPASTVPGPTGKTAYEYAVEAGYTGTETEFANAQLPDTIGWADVEGKPTSYPPETHTHSQGEVDGLNDRLAVIEDAIDAPGADWETLPGLASDVEVAGHGAPPQILRLGAWRYIRGRFVRTGGADFASGANYLLATLEPDDRPAYTQGGIGQGTISAYARIEVTGDGKVTSRPSMDTGWVGVDGVFWTTK